MALIFFPEVLLLGSKISWNQEISWKVASLIECQKGTIPVHSLWL